MIKIDTTKLYLGIDIGGTKCAVVVGSDIGQIYKRKDFPSGKDRDPHEIIAKIILLGKSIIDEYSNEHAKFQTVGISCGGPLDTTKGIIHAPPNLPLWDNIPIVEILEKELKLPVFIQNDANACAVAEWKFGSGKGYQNVVFLTFGTGLGAGLILDGKLYTGTNGMAGEIGHIRLTPDGPIGYHKEGSFEGYCSGNGIKKLCEIIVRECWHNSESVNFCQNENVLQKLTAKDIFKYAQNGDAVAQKIIDICAEHLGKGLAIIVDMLNPECIIIGSIYSRDEDMLKDRMYQTLKKEALSKSLNVCKIKPATLGNQVGDYAALTVAIINDK